MQDFSGLYKALSVERLTNYRLDPADTDRTVAARYLWNVAIAESLHTCLHFAEVSLRNAIHEEMRVKHSDPMWFENPKVVSPSTLTAMAKVREDLEKEGRLPSTITSGDLVAKATFGFWVSFFYGAYVKPTHPLWSGHSLKRVFPHATTLQRKPSELRSTLERIRRLRNRVSHHEPVWGRSNLQAAHAEVHEVIRWLNPEVAALAKQLDRFPAVYQNGPAVFFTIVDTAFPDIP